MKALGNVFGTILMAIGIYKLYALWEAKQMLGVFWDQRMVGSMATNAVIFLAIGIVILFVATAKFTK